MKTATFATLFTFAASTLAAQQQQTLQLSASGSPLQFIDVPEAGKRVLAASTSAAPVTLNNGLLSSSLDGQWVANIDGGLVTFSESQSSMPGNVSVNSQGVVSHSGSVESWYLCEMGDAKALAYGSTDGLSCEEVTLVASPESSETETITIKAVPSSLSIFGNDYPAPQQQDMALFWSGLAKALISLFGTMGLGGVVAYRGLQEKTFEKKKVVSFAE